VVNLLLSNIRTRSFRSRNSQNFFTAILVDDRLNHSVGKLIMAYNIAGISREVSRVLRQNIGQIIAVHLAYVALGVILFTPLVGIAGKLLLRFSGQTVVADQDIIYFLLTPSGMVALILFSGLLITILAFEQASMMLVCGYAMRGLHIGVMQSLHFTARRALRIFSFTNQLVVRLLAITLPFLATGGAVGWMLVTDYDINYYLAEKPPEFLFAVALIGLLLLVMLVLLVRRLLAWSLALPLILFAGVSPSRSFSESKNLTEGHQRLFLLTLGIWASAAFLLGAIVLGSVQFLGAKLAPLFLNSINWLVVILGALVALWSLGNLLVTTFASGSFASLLMTLYERYGPGLELNGLAQKLQSRQWRLTAPRLALVLIISAAGAVFVGSWLLNDIQTKNDNVVIIAHRGAAGKAPENTLASVQEAIRDGADWIEIDVQESSDGEVVVIHDSDFMKLAGVNLKVWDATLKQLKEIDIGSWFAPDFSAERIPTLLEVLEKTRGQARVMIELKYYGHDQQLEQRVVDIVEQAEMVNDVAVMSLKYDGVRKVRELRPDWVVGLLSAQAIGNLAKMDVDFLAVNIGMATPHFIKNAQLAGKQVFAWTVNDQIAMSRMMSLGIDGVITDEPELARNVLAERSDMSTVERLLMHTAVLLGRPVPEKIYRDQSP